MPAGVYRASSIRVAEAAKVIENTQRDLNIALMNELAIIFDKLGLDTLEVLEAAGTKWNFLPFRPGLVGGHCIGVDPYYLTHKAEMIGYHPQVILAGRRINDGMGKFIAEQTVKQMIAARQPHQGRPGQRARPHLQGGRARPAQLQGDRHHPRAAQLRRRGVRARSDRRCRMTRTKSTASSSSAGTSLPVADAVVVAVGHRDYLERPLGAYSAKLRFRGVLHRRQVEVRSRRPARGRLSRVEAVEGDEESGVGAPLLPLPNLPRVLRTQGGVLGFTFSASAPSVPIVEAHDVVFAEVVAALNLDHHQIRPCPGSPADACVRRG